eukprot:GHVS01092051.1.p1 GENE.GHVS01092051.1~~GHVS01092051.1.p1  ORF type:complete len:610 (+),score=155.21 GHVS01092051.1:264-2093(+)
MCVHICCYYRERWVNRCARPILSRHLAFPGRRKSSLCEVEWQPGYPGYPGSPSNSYRRVDKHSVFLMNSYDICKCRDMLRRFGVFFHQDLMSGSTQVLRDELQRRHAAAFDPSMELYVHDYFMDGKPRHADTVDESTESMKGHIDQLRDDMYATLQHKVFPDKVVAYQQHWDKHRVLKGEYDTALHIDHSLQHKHTGYNPQNVTLLTTWVALNSSGPREGLSVLFPNGRSGHAAAEGMWGAMNAQQGSVLIFLETTPHANFKATEAKPQKQLRMSVEMRWTLSDPHPQLGSCDHTPVTTLHTHAATGGGVDVGGGVDIGTEQPPFLCDTDERLLSCRLCLVARRTIEIRNGRAQIVQTPPKWPSPTECWIFRNYNKQEETTTTASHLGTAAVDDSRHSCSSSVVSTRPSPVLLPVVAPTTTTPLLLLPSHQHHHTHNSMPLTSITNTCSRLTPTTDSFDDVDEISWFSSVFVPLQDEPAAAGGGAAKQRWGVGCLIGRKRKGDDNGGVTSNSKQRFSSAGDGITSTTASGGVTTAGGVTTSGGGGVTATTSAGGGGVTTSGGGGATTSGGCCVLTDYLCAGKAETENAVCLWGGKKLVNAYRIYDCYYG